MSASSCCKVNDKRIEKAVCDFWVARARDEENGTARTMGIDQPWDAVFHDAHVCVVKNIVVADDGERCWKVTPRYSKRKTRGCYPQLRPALMRLDIEASEVEPLLRSEGASDIAVRRALGKPRPQPC